MATIPSQVKDIVTFVFVRRNQTDLTPNGTAFFVGVKSEQDPKRLFGYLVTAKHVLQDRSESYYPSVFIRLNNRSGGSNMIELPLKGQNAVPIHVHADPQVDIAVLPILPDTSIHDFKVLPEEMLITREGFREANIREGDEVFFTGLFTGFLEATETIPL